MLAIELCQRCAPEQLFPVPHGPKGDLRLTQTFQVLGVLALRRGDVPHLIDVRTQELHHPRIRKIVNNDQEITVHMGSSATNSASEEYDVLDVSAGSRTRRIS